MTRNPQRPTPQPREPTQRKKAHRGGSFLCTESVLLALRSGYTGKGEVSTGTNHLGFRCVKPVNGTNISAKNLVQ